MSTERKHGKGGARKGDVAGGFWGHAKPKPMVLRVHHSSSRIARTLAFLRKLVGWERGDIH